MLKFLSNLGAVLRRHIRISSAILVIALAAVLFGFLRGGSDVQYRTVKLERGDLNVSISATGTLQPEEVVDVGAQIAGQISFFGKDKKGETIDYRSEVEEGMVLAKIDDVTYLSDLSQAQAQFKRSEANVLQMKAKSNQAERDWARAQKLGPSDALSQSSYDSYKAALEIAQANVTVAEAEVAQAQALVARAERNLSYCTIKSPVNGVVIDRRVNIGQTVVASLNAPSLFLIAKDLRKMQVWVSVNEADIGKIFPGQKAVFTVDAFPGEEYQGVVIKVRLNASMSQNVVSYIVELAADNPQGRLMPYLTANVKFDVSDRKGVWLLPNTALRFQPRAAALPLAGGQKNIWVFSGGQPAPVPVRVGESDGTRTEVSGENLSEGMEVITGEQGSEVDVAMTAPVNPLAPAMPHGRGRR